MTLPAEEPPDLAFTVELPAAPYPGLRPFNTDEWPIFFGRERMADEVVGRLIRQHLVVVHGDSGCGKSSLVRAGVLAQLEHERARSGVRWRTAAMLPREAPLRRLAEAIAGLRDAADDPDELHRIRRILNRATDAPAALAELLRGETDDHICILVDQFEELFAFAKQHGREEAQLFVDLLVGLQKNPPPGLYAILTMRSEFLGHCARFTGLAEATNKTQYLLPQMERPALMRAICEPAGLYRGEVSRALAERLIADAGGEQDQLPLIQHGLMRLYWDKIGPPPARDSGLAEVGSSFRHDNLLEDAPVSFRHETGSEGPVARPVHEADDAATPSSYDRRPAWRLGLEDYRGGDLAVLLSDHADQVMAAAAPDPHRQKIVEHLFRALTDINAEGQAVRRPQTLAQLLMAVTGSDEQTLTDIIDQFREEGVSFLRPYGTVLIEPENEIDISHEALIRCWQRIADEKEGWLQREFQDGLIWKSLRLQAQKGETLSAATTTDRDAWLTTVPRSWCERYGGGWADVEQLMERSREERARFEQREQQARIGDSYFRAEQAKGQLKEQLPVTAIQLALAGLPDQPEDPQARPWVSETAGWLVEAMAAQRERLCLQGHPGVIAAAISSDGARIVTRSSYGSVRTYDVVADKLTTGHVPGDFAVIAYSPDGTRTVRTSSDRSVRVWDAASSREIFAPRPENEYWSHIAAFSPDGSRIVIGSHSYHPKYNHMVLLWDVASSKEPLTLRGHKRAVSAVAFSPDSTRIVSGSDDQTVRVWDAGSGRQLLAMRRLGSTATTVSFSSDGTRIVAGFADGTLRVWLDASRASVRLWMANRAELLVLRGHKDAVHTAAFSFDGTRIVSGSADTTVRVWDAVNGATLLDLHGHGGGVTITAFSHDGRSIVSGSDDRTVRLWDTSRSSNEFLILRHPEGEVSIAAFSPDGTRIVSGSLGTLRVWDAVSGEELLVLPYFTLSDSAAFSPDGTRIVSGALGNTVAVWDAATGKEMLTLRGHEGSVRATAFSPDGALVVSASWDKTVRVWDLASGKELLVLPGHENWVRAAGFSPDGARIVSGSWDKTVRLWDAASGKELLVLNGHEREVSAAAFSPDGACVVSASSDKTVRLWDAASGKELLVLSGHEREVTAAAFSPDGARIVSGSKDGTVRVWDVASGAELLVLRGHQGAVNAAAFSPDGARVVSASDDHTIRVTWIGRSQQELIETARARLPRELTEEEKRRFYLTAQ